MSIQNNKLETIKKEFEGIIAKKQLSLELIDKKELEKAIITLFNRITQEKNFNANVTISAGTQEMSNQYGEAIAEVLEKLFQNSCGQILETDLLDERIRRFKLRRNKIILVKNCTVKAPEKLYDALHEIETKGWEPAVILCFTQEVLERVKAYDFQDYRLYHYLCGQKVCISDIHLDNILKLTIESLEREGFVCKEDFCQKLGHYIKAVYPEAQLTQKAFVEDLIFRIYQAHFQKIVSGNELDAGDVPYSAKAEMLVLAETEDLSEVEGIEGEKVAAESEDSEITEESKFENPSNQPVKDSTPPEKKKKR